MKNIFEALGKFMEGKKTYTGIVISFLPILSMVTKIQAPQEEIQMFLSAVFGLCGSIIAIYGYYSKK